MHAYRNPWHTPGKAHYGPEFFQTAVTPIEYRGFLIFERIKGQSWELVKDGLCLTQRAGRNGPRKLVDALHGEATDDEWNVERARTIAARYGVALPCPAYAEGGRC